MAGSPVVISATAKHTATLIFLHGLGDTGTYISTSHVSATATLIAAGDMTAENMRSSKFIPVASHGWASAMGAIRSPHMKVICPTAPTMPVTLNAGFRMPSWFDLRTLDANGPEDEEGIRRATELVHSLLEQEINNGIPSNRIVLGGFSQGGALALYSALLFPKPLAGVIALSCWLPLHKNFPAAAVANTDIPYIQCHGDCDPIVPYKWGQMTAFLMKQFLKHTEFKTYRGMMHSSSDEEMRDLKTFLDKVTPPE